MKDIKEKIKFIIEKSNNDKPACKNCISCKEGCCTFGYVNERNGGAYRFANKKVTSPDYSCSNFNSVYNFNESTLDTLRDLLSDVERVEEGIKNLDLLIDNKINENDFVDIMR